MTTTIECILDGMATLNATRVAVAINDQLTTVVISPPGEVRSLVGTWLMDQEAAATVIAAFDRHGTDVVIDYDHGSEGGAYSPPDGVAKAAGWITKLWFDPTLGLLAFVKWNATARDLIRSDEFRYLSPALIVRLSDRRPVVLKSVALTNTPAMPNTEQVAASRKTLLLETTTEIKAMSDQPTPASPQAPTTAPAERLIGELKAALAAKGMKLADTATREDILQAAIKAITGESDAADKGGDAKADDKTETDVTATARLALGLPAGAPVSAVRVALHEAGRLRTEVATLRSTAAGATADLATRTIEDRVQKHIDAGRIRAADTEDLAACRKLASENPELFESMMSRRELPAQGRTVTADEGFDSRQEIIASTKVKWQSEKLLQDFTTMSGLVDVKLSDAGLSKLSDTEKSTL